MIVASRSGTRASMRSSTTPGLVVEQLHTHLLELLQRDDPVAVGDAVERDDPEHTGNRVTGLAQLVHLGLVLGEDDLAAGVGQDVGDVRGDRRRVDGGGGGARAHDGQVGSRPLVARGGGHRDAVLGGDTQGDEPGCEPVRLLADLAPRERPPQAVAHELVGDLVLGRLDPAAEQVRHAGRPVVDDRLVHRLVSGGRELLGCGGHCHPHVACRLSGSCHAVGRW